MNLAINKFAVIMVIMMKSIGLSTLDSLVFRNIRNDIGNITISKCCSAQDGNYFKIK